MYSSSVSVLTLNIQWPNTSSLFFVLTYACEFLINNSVIAEAFASREAIFTTTSFASAVNVETSDGTLVYAYDKRMCYFDTLIEQF